MTLDSGLRVRSQPVVSEATVIYRSLDRGVRFIVLEGPVAGSGYFWYRVGEFSGAVGDRVSEGWVASAAFDGTPWIAATPEACQSYTFEEADVSVASLAELQAGFVGTWAGCVSTPWTEPYWVTLTFREDGSYRGSAQPLQLKPYAEPAFYYGSDEDSELKVYELNDLQDDLEGIGQIDIVFSADSVNRDELRNIRLMGDRLEFEFFHHSQYGPLIFQLERVIAG